MKTNVHSFLEFLNASHSNFHAVYNLENMLQGAGYTRLSRQDVWELTAGGKYYVKNADSALIAFRVPTVEPTRFFITASHADRPTFKVKENAALVGQYTRLSTEKYGGMLMSTWLDRPLSIAGRVMVETENGVKAKLLDIDQDLLLIPNVAIHMNRKANEGYAYNPAVDTLPLVSTGDTKEAFDGLLQETAGGKILGHDLYLYLRQPAKLWGLQEEFISGQALDDLACVWGCAQGFIQADETDTIPVLAVLDSEEVGSATNQGADSTFLADTLSRICGCLQLEEKQVLSGSFLVSADNAHAVHPNHPELSDANNAPLPGAGVVIKFNANGRYTTDGLSAAVFRKICQNAQVPVQTYCNRADIAGGSTLGAISLSHVSVPSVDIGLAQLAMHSCYETMAAKDIEDLVSAVCAFYGASIRDDGEGNLEIG